jgi:ATP phosphoribosyltransferase
MNQAQKQLQDHFDTLQAMISDLKAKIEARQVTPLRVAPPPPEERLDRVRRLLSGAGSVTASEVQLDLGVRHSTAMRAIRDLARAQEGIMVLEPTGPTFRVRLWHPDRVILDAPTH